MATTGQQWVDRGGGVSELTYGPDSYVQGYAPQDTLQQAGYTPQQMSAYYAQPKQQIANTGNWNLSGMRPDQLTNWANGGMFTGNSGGGFGGVQNTNMPIQPKPQMADAGGMGGGMFGGGAGGMGGGASLGMVQQLLAHMFGGGMGGMGGGGMGQMPGALGGARNFTSMGPGNMAPMQRQMPRAPSIGMPGINQNTMLSPFLGTDQMTARQMQQQSGMSPALQQQFFGNRPGFGVPNTAQPQPQQPGGGQTLGTEGGSNGSLGTAAGSPEPPRTSPDWPAWYANNYANSRNGDAA